MQRIKEEPALLVGLVEAVLALALAFGLALSAAQIGAILAVVAAVGAVTTRQTVKPMTKVYEDEKIHEHELSEQQRQTEYLIGAAHDEEV